MTITKDDIEEIYINELGRIVIILKEDYSECGERARLARMIMADRAKRELFIEEEIGRLKKVSKCLKEEEECES